MLGSINVVTKFCGKPSNSSQDILPKAINVNLLAYARGLPKSASFNLWGP